MIRIKTVHIEEFRGVRSLDLCLDKDNFAICGPNGTGKSGVVDAIEFCLTGDVTRLSGEGMAGLSVKSHAPHVDQRENPEKAHVIIAAEIPSLNKTVTIRRSVKNPKQLDVSPADTDVLAVVEELQTHPEFALSRREIVKYIITPPGKRSVDVQTLLRLEHINNLRKSLTTFTNKCKSDADNAEGSLLKAAADLRNVLKIDKLELPLILERINEKRRILGLQNLNELTKDTIFKAGVAAPKQAGEKQGLRKSVALRDLSSLQSATKAQEPKVLAENRQEAKSILEELNDDHHALRLAQTHGFIKIGLDLITENACPLCDKEWDAEALREHLRQKLLSAEETEKLIQKLRMNITPILHALSERMQAVTEAIKYSEALSPPVDKIALEGYLSQVTEAESALSGFLKDHSLIEPAVKTIKTLWWSPTADQQTCIDQCHTAIDALSDASPEDAAQELLIVSQERYERYLIAKNTADALKTRGLLAQKILDHYNNSCTTVLEKIYDQVANDFSTFYGIINHEDEDKFVGKLKSAPAKLNFDVDFYGRGLFPPGAYHSEGHQDAMGLCLYLALMKHTLGDKFTFTVLDDVLMSVDTGHRREVCRLLKTEFPNTQFIITTHDRVWLQYMKTEGLIVHSQSFSGWTVDAGPRVLDGYDTWKEIECELDKNDVAKASWLLRRHLEYTAAILADNLRANVEFRGDAHYDLGDLMPRVLKKWRDRLELGVKSATHWNREDEKVSLMTKVDKAKELIAATNAEQWAINPSVHFNEWANLQASEFQKVVTAFKALLENIRCENCKSYLYVSPRKGEAEEIRCNCSSVNINLKMRK